MTTIFLSDEGLARLKVREEYRVEPYQDPAGHWTWGYGHRLTDDEIKEIIISKTTYTRKDITDEFLTKVKLDKINDAKLDEIGAKISKKDAGTLLKEGVD